MNIKISGTTNINAPELEFQDAQGFYGIIVVPDGKYAIGTGAITPADGMDVIHRLRCLADEIEENLCEECAKETGAPIEMARAVLDLVMAGIVD